MIIGSLKINNCTIQSMIPIWLVVTGVVGFVIDGLQITQVKIVSDFNSTIKNITIINSVILSSFTKHGVLRNTVHRQAS